MQPQNSPNEAPEKVLIAVPRLSLYDHDVKMGRFYFFL